MKNTLCLTLLLFVTLSTAIGLGMWKIHQLINSKILIKKEVIFTLKAGTGRLSLVKQLYDKKMISYPYLLQWKLRLDSELSCIKAGTYRFIPGMSVCELIKLLENGKEVQFPLRFVEGMRLSNYLKQLREAPYIQHTLKDDSYETVTKELNLTYLEQIEGWFWPDTWLYTAGTTDVTILKRAFNKMYAAVERSWKNRAEGLPYKNRNQFITMASIVEKETAVDHERKKIASVFINRLRVGMRLQTDPTVIYGMQANYNGRISNKDIKTPTAYNTYVINGLPPGPIAVPSQASLDAAAHPAETAYLYFVSDGKGKHVFNTNLISHNRSVRSYLKTLTDLK